VEKEKESEREIERLTAENTALKARVAELDEITDGLGALVNEYDRVLNDSTDELVKVTNALKDAKSVKVSIEGEGILIPLDNERIWEK
jgi:uncharacterized protein YlxW (UPF0749 family)